MPHDPRPFTRRTMLGLLAATAWAPAPAMAPAMAMGQADHAPELQALLHRSPVAEAAQTLCGTWR